MKYLVLLSLLALAAACNRGDENLAPIANAVVDENSSADLEEILVELEITTLDPLTQQPYYVLPDSIYEIATAINGFTWGVFRQVLPPADTVGTLTLNGFVVSPTPQSHYLVLNHLQAAEDVQTAGEAADFLKGFLLPGDYFFEIKELKINNLNNEPQPLSLDETRVIEVEPAARSVFAGKVTIQI